MMSVMSLSDSIQLFEVHVDQVAAHTLTRRDAYAVAYNQYREVARRLGLRPELVRGMAVDGLRADGGV